MGSINGGMRQSMTGVSSGERPMRQQHLEQLSWLFWGVGSNGFTSLEMSRKHVKMGGVEGADSTPATKGKHGTQDTHTLPRSKCPEQLKSEWRKLRLKCQWSYGYYGGRHG
jgi:hypothetical protein